MSAAPKLKPTASGRPIPVSRSSAATAAAPRRQHARPESEQPSRAAHLRAVAAPEQARSIVPFAMLCVAIIVAALASVLFINIAMTEGAYERRDLKIEIAQLAQERDDLVSELEASSAAPMLAQRASELGMQSADSLGFVSLEQGVVLKARAG
ncbi:hypothetical protein [Demequina salsinemoris]|uniref:hypothetical protein n=1 Tax=Demequina salsinemoris TaxID=577470 RepID=UPI000785DDBC|nr:hypothetical protein [Demequina salsinemoris]